MKKKSSWWNRLLVACCFTVSLLAVGYIGYQQNWLDVQALFIRHQQKVGYQRAQRTTQLSQRKRQQIRRQIMRQTQKSQGLTKQGFVSVPQVGILQPIFNDAYSQRGLAAGANYANRSAVDPAGKQVPKMGRSNYGLASHNFYDGKTGFSPLQQHLKKDAPYIIDGKIHENKWLNGEKIYLANGSGIYEYRITGQRVVTPDDVKVLNPTKKARVTIITCLYPSTQYRIITVGVINKRYHWYTAPAKVVSFFDLTKQKTNARVNWYNPGTEEGSNGNAGGTRY